MLADLRGPMRLAPSLCPTGGHPPEALAHATSAQRAFLVSDLTRTPNSIAEPSGCVSPLVRHVFRLSMKGLYEHSKGRQIEQTVRYLASVL